MDESTTVSSLDDRKAGISDAETTARGVVQTFVDLAELRRLLRRLTTVELVRMMVAETLG